MIAGKASDRALDRVARVRCLIDILRVGPNLEAFESTPIGQAMLAAFGSPQAAIEWIDRAIAGLGKGPPMSAAARRFARQATILARYDRGRESCATVMSELAISRRLFFAERAAALKRLDAVVAEVVAPPEPTRTRDPFASRLTDIQASIDAGQAARALCELQEFERDGLGPRQRAEVLAGMVEPSIQLRNIASAQRAVARAKRCLAEVGNGERAQADALVLIAELRLSHHVFDARSFNTTLIKIREWLKPSAALGDLAAIEVLVTAAIEEAEFRAEIAEGNAAEEALREADRLGATMGGLPPALHIARLLAAARAHVGMPEYFGHAGREGVRAYRLAKEFGYERQVANALRILGVVAYTRNYGDAAALFAQSVIQWGRRNGEAATELGGNILASSADTVRGRPDRALARLESCRALLADPYEELDLEMTRARALCMQDNVEASMALLSRVIALSSTLDLPMALGVALSLRSRIAARSRDVSAARRDLGQGLNLLARHPTPLHLMRTYRLAYSLTGRSVYRNDADDIWQLIAPAFRELEELTSLADELVSAEDGQAIVEGPTQSIASPLTPRERSIAKLVQAGRTNREIAADLRISVRTVDQHIQSILRRLNVERRWQIADALQPTNGSPAAAR